MNTTQPPRVIEEDTRLNTNHQKESTMQPTASSLIRWSGLAAIAAGIIFAGIQPIHPPDFLPSVTTPAWAIIVTLKWVMCLFFLVGITGLYARQVKEAGWLGLAGFVLLILSWWLQTAYVFIDVFVLPVLATAAPKYVDSFLGIVNQHPGEMNIGALPAIYGLLGVFYMLGGLVFGIATLRAGILPRWPAGLLAVAAAVTPAAALLPHEIQRFAAVPVAFALAWLGYALWSERRAPAVASEAGSRMPQLRQTGAR